MIELAYRFGGVIGIDPGPFTLRELFWLVDGHARQVWQHTASILAAAFANNPNVKKPKFTPDKFYPFAMAKKRTVIDGTIADLKLLIPKKGKKG